MILPLGRKKLWIVIFFPLALVYLSFILLFLHRHTPFLVSSLSDFMERLALVNGGQLVYRDFSFEYPPLFFLVLLIESAAAGLFKFLPYPESILAIHLFLLLPIISTIYLILISGKRVLSAVFLLLLSAPLMGASFDLFAVVLSVAALLLASRKRYLFSLFLLSLASGIKIYPLIYLPFILLWTKSPKLNLKHLVFFSVCVAAPFVFVISYGGGEGIIGFFRVHLTRGIQNESVLATPYFLFSELFGSKREFYFRNGAYEISYGSIDWIIGLVGILAFATLYLNLFFKAVRRLFGRVREKISQEVIFDLSTCLTLFLLVSSKVLSVQFLLWFLLLVPFVSDGLFKKIYLPALLVGLLTTVGAGIITYYNQFTVIPIIIRNILLTFITYSSVKDLKL